MKRTIATLCSVVGMAMPTTSRAIHPIIIEVPYYREYRITVKKGENLIAIAKRAYGDRKQYLEIARRNNIESPYRIYVGEKLILPGLVENAEFSAEDMR